MVLEKTGILQIDQSLLKEYKNGIYEITVDFKAAKPDGQYKVALNRNWDKAYGDTKVLMEIRK